MVGHWVTISKFHHWLWNGHEDNFKSDSGYEQSKAENEWNAGCKRKMITCRIIKSVKKNQHQKGPLIKKGKQLKKKKM